MPSTLIRTLSGRLSAALRRRCPRCGSRPFDGYFTLRSICPGCGLAFEREEGYWVGALIVNTTFAFATFVATFVGGVALSWPEVPWGGLMAATVGLNALVPVLFYPLSKTVWVALDLTWHPVD